MGYQQCLCESSYIVMLWATLLKKAENNTTDGPGAICVPFQMLTIISGNQLCVMSQGAPKIPLLDQWQH